MKSPSTRRVVFFLCESLCPLRLCARLHFFANPNSKFTTRILFFSHEVTKYTKGHEGLYSFFVNLCASWLCARLHFLFSHQLTKYTKGHEGLYSFFLNLFALCGFVGACIFFFLAN